MCNVLGNWGKWVYGAVVCRTKLQFTGSLIAVCFIPKCRDVVMQ
jgi:hypothetical protein